MTIEVKREPRRPVTDPITEIVATSSANRVLKAFDEGPSGYISISLNYSHRGQYMMGSFLPQDIIDLGDALVELGQQVRDK